MRTSKRKGVFARGDILRAYAPFFLVFLVGLLYHLRMRPMGGDDLFFSSAVDEMGLWAYLAHRYVNWTSRVVSEFVLVNVIRIPLLWRVIDLLMFATLPVILSRMFGGGKLMNWCSSAAVLLFPFHDMGTAGWITTTVTHFWPLWGICYVGLLVKRMLVRERIHPAEGCFGVLVCVVTCSHEQYAVILLVILALYGSLLWRKHGERPMSGDSVADIRPANLPLFIALLTVNLASLLVILLCPGNAARNAVSIADLPVYAEFGFGEKLYLGLLGIERVFIANADAVFFAVTCVWTILVYGRTKKYVQTLVSGLPLLVLFGQTVLRTTYPGLSGLFVIPGEILEWSWGELSTWIPMVYLAVCLGAMIYALCLLLGEEPFACAGALLLLGSGFGAGMVLGFMATIYVSGERVYAPLYIGLLVVTLYAVSKQRGMAEQWARSVVGKLAVTLFAVLCLTNILFIGLSA